MCHHSAGATANMFAAAAISFFMVAAVTASTALATTSEIVPLFISASSHPSQQGFVRIITTRTKRATANARGASRNSER